MELSVLFIKMRVSEMKGVKIYDLSSGKTVPEFIEEAKHSKKKLKKMESTTPLT